MTKRERKKALKQMQAVSDGFYDHAVKIGVHPFIEFCGLMNEYIKACEAANAKGIDFTECNTHTGQQLPMAPYNVEYVNEKLECIFTGRSVMARIEDILFTKSAVTELKHRVGTLEVISAGILKGKS